MNFFDHLGARVREPSTWAGISILATMFGAPPGSIDLVSQVITGIAGLFAIVAPESKSLPHAAPAAAPADAPKA